MDFFSASSVEELKKCGKLKQVRAVIKEMFEPNIKIKANTWENLYKSINDLKKIIPYIPIETETKQTNNLYFKGDAEKYIFFLLELDGKERSDRLGINKVHHIDKEVATQWRNKIAKIIHPDVCKHCKAEKAMAKLNEIYEGMIE